MPNNSSSDLQSDNSLSYNRDQVNYQPIDNTCASSSSSSSRTASALGYQEIAPSVDSNRNIPRDQAMAGISDGINDCKVIFVEIAESYPTDCDIECRFYLSSPYPLSPQDKVGLFKVGWKDVDESLILREISQANENNEFSERILSFESQFLPKDDSVMYQFVYVDVNQHQVGVSTPFRFFRADEEDLIQLENKNGSENEDEFVVVRSQQALLHERLQQLVNANGMLEFSKRSLEHETKKQGKVMEELRKLVKIGEEQLDIAVDKLRCAEEKNCQMESQLEELNEDVTVKSDLIKKISLELEETKRKMEVEKLRIGEEKNMQLEELNREMNVNNELIKKIRIELDDCKGKMLAMSVDIETKTTTLAKILSEKRDLETENKLFRNENEDLKAKCDAMENNKELMMKEILDLERIKLKSKVEVKVQMENAEEMRKKYEEEISFLKLDMKKREEMELEKERQWKSKLDEMTVRLVQAANEYEGLYKMNNKLESKLLKIKDKIKKHNENKKEKITFQDEAFNDESFLEQMRKYREIAEKVKVEHDRSMNGSGDQVSGDSSSAANVDQLNPSVTQVKRVMSIPIDPIVQASDIQIVGQMRGASGGHSNDQESFVSVITLPCSICSKQITCTNSDTKPMTTHLEEKHGQKLCPMCSMMFDMNLPGHERYFHWHIEGHFERNMRDNENTSEVPAMIP